MTTPELEEILRETFCRESAKMSEREALEAALNVASEWQMRLDELEADE